MDAHYAIETVDAVRIEVRNHGIRQGAQAIMNRVTAGEFVPSTHYYFRTTPRFYPPGGTYEWLKRLITIGDAERHADLVVVRVWS